MTNESKRQHSKSIAVVIPVIGAIILFGGGWLIGRLGVAAGRRRRRGRDTSPVKSRRSFYV